MPQLQYANDQQRRAGNKDETVHDVAESARRSSTFWSFVLGQDNFKLSGAAKASND